MAAIRCDEFKREAFRIALTSGLTRRQVVSHSGIWLSTLGSWVRAVREVAKVTAQDAELLRENERLRQENRILKEAREMPKKAAIFFAVRGNLIRGHLCRLMDVSERGLHAWKHRPHLTANGATWCSSRKSPTSTASAWAAIAGLA